MQGYLLDVNHVSALFCKNPKLIQKIESLPSDTQIRACTITLGELYAGNVMTANKNPQRRSEHKAFINESFLPNALPITVSTGEYYAKIMGAIWQQTPPKPGKKTEQHLRDLGVDINDIWISASAWEHGFILLTQDKMACIKKAAPVINFDCWI